jgi:hypothetical protein
MVSTARRGLAVADLEAYAGDLWPYLLVVIVGFLPTEIWRLLGMSLSSRLNENSEFFLWVRAVASALLAAVTAKLVFSPSGALAAVPLLARLASLGLGLGGFFLLRRSIVVGVALAELALVLSIWLSG